MLAQECGAESVCVKNNFSFTNKIERNTCDTVLCFDVFQIFDINSTLDVLRAAKVKCLIIDGEIFSDNCDKFPLLKIELGPQLNGLRSTDKRRPQILTLPNRVAVEFFFQYHGYHFCDLTTVHKDTIANPSLADYRTNRRIAYLASLEANLMP